MAYIMTNKKTGDYLVKVDIRGGIVFMPTTNINKATAYQTYEQLLDDIGEAHYYSGIDAGTQIYNAPPHRKE